MMETINCYGYKNITVVEEILDELLIIITLKIKDPSYIWIPAEQLKIKFINWKTQLTTKIRSMDYIAIKK